MARKNTAPRSEKPLILALDSAGSAASVVVARGARILARRHRETAHGHAELLLPLIDEAMRDAQFLSSDLDIVAVTVGPGGFTGIRAGLAAAQGIALATGARLCGVTGFAAVAELHGGPGQEQENSAGLLVAIESRRADLYVQLFERGGRPVTGPASVMPEDIALVPGICGPISPLVVAGDGAPRAAAALSWRPDLFVIGESAPDALGVAAVANRRWLGGETEAPARPLYLHAPDVTLPRSRATS